METTFTNKHKVTTCSEKKLIDIHYYNFDDNTISYTMRVSFKKAQGGKTLTPVERDSSEFHLKHWSIQKFLTNQHFKVNLTWLFFYSIKSIGDVYVFNKKLWNTSD